MLSGGARLLLSPNHLTDADQYVLISLVKREEVLNPFIGNSFMAAKAPLFTRPVYKGGTILRRALDELGGIPVFRRVDIEQKGKKTPPEIERLYRQALRRANEVQVAKLIAGNHMGNFPEGTRNRVNHKEVQTLKDGFAYTAIDAAQEVAISIVPIGIYYGGEPKSNKKQDVPSRRKPHIHIGMPIAVDPSSVPEELSLHQVHPAIQYCVDVAVQAYNDRAA